MKKEIKKNLYDLEYNRILNNQNVVFILVGTLVIGLILSDYSIKFKVLTMLALLLFIVYFRHAFNKKLKNIKNDIMEL